MMPDAGPGGAPSVYRQLGASVPIRTASGGAQIAIPILAVHTTGSVALGATLVALAMLPSIVAAPLVGALLDAARRPKALMMVAAAGVAVTYAAAAGLGTLPVWLVAASLMVNGTLSPFGFGGLSSFVAPPTGDTRRAYAIDALSYNVSGVAGPAIVAALAPTVGPAQAMLAMGAVAFVSLAAYPLLPMHPRDGDRAPLLRSIGAGFVALTTHRPLAIVTLAGTLSEFGRGILPIAAIGMALVTTGDASESAVIITAFAVGALLGAAVETVRRPWISPQLTMGIGFVLTGMATVAAVAGLGFTWMLVLIGLSGLFTAAPVAAMLLLRRTESPPSVVAQVFTVGAAFRATAAATGTAAAGVFAHVDPLLLLVASGAIWMLSGALMAAFPRRG